MTATACTTPACHGCSRIWNWPTATAVKPEVAGLFVERLRSLAKLFRTLTKVDLLILDATLAKGWGPDRLNPSQRRDLMEIVEERYGRGSTLITSQLTVDTWHGVIGEPTFADAILDRLVHNAYRLALDGPSLRKLAGSEALGAESKSEPLAAAEPEQGLPMKKGEAGGNFVPEGKPAKGGRK